MKYFTYVSNYDILLLKRKEALKGVAQVQNK